MVAIQVIDRGHVWKIPLKYIAENYAKNYEDDPDSSYEEEFNYVMENPYVGQEWFLNNMDWKDVVEYAQLIKTPPPLKEPDFINSNVFVVVAQSEI